MQYNTTRYIDENQDNKTLKDMMKNGKQRPWREKNIKDYTIKLREQKTRKQKQIPLYHLKKDIDRYIQFLEDEDYLFKSNKLDSEAQIKPISRVQAYRILNHSAKSIGLSEIGTHSMRKTFGYHYYKKTKDVALLMDLFNHSSQVVTLRYVGISQEVINSSISETMQNVYY
ncbi:tyrosine-type recombinase/integrase (plasmid) [Staphylococcus aureus]|nr:tyrosine-type recombinase/integrase [Staphylococcus aureus]MCH4751206.1 tyrosine-type recombinase/integrase [Staphylococcus aureus]MCH4791653.1 tyrosine-type recombinase/integrase [Staphylococcus aureus]MCH4794281.1 tyrosine-type recombinase/integrase [Staphylococcus aureus]